MLKVSNNIIIRKLSLRSFKVNRARNIIAVIAIALTSILFTSIFTIAMTMNYSWQQQTMRMLGGDAHGGFKYLTEEQLDKLKVHPLIKKYGVSLMLAMPTQVPFNKHHTELRYADENGAGMFFSRPSTGRMPQGRDELATDTRVLDLLGIPREIGQKVELSYPLGDKTITDTFTLCGYWEGDKAIQASQVWLSLDYVEQRLSGYVRHSEKDTIGSWGLDIMFSSSRNIQKNLETIARDNGFQITDPTGGNYLYTGVNWAYTETHLNRSDKLMTFTALLIIFLLIIFSGYLIIYNIFEISVINDIRFYGLLKTIGTTPRQIKRMIRNQAVLLSLIGIPFGLIIGFIVGNSLSGIIMNSMFVTRSYVTFNPFIFIGSAVFSLITVFLSCRKPGKLAGAVSPVEAVRYVENSNTGQAKVRKTGPVKIHQMALANILRRKKKTFLVIVSLALSVVLLNGVYSFAKGFDMHKYLGKFVITDYILGNSDYFQSRYALKSQNVSESLINAVNAQEGVTETGRVYRFNGICNIAVDADAYWKIYWRIRDIKNDQLPTPERDGKYLADVDLYGYDRLPLKQLKVLEGDLEKLESGDKKYIVQLVTPDDYGKPEMQGAVFKPGDKINIDLSGDFEYSEDGKLNVNSSFSRGYEVAATAMVEGNMTLRRYGNAMFALPSESFISDTGSKDTMIYMLNADKAYNKEIDDFIKNYTEKAEPAMDYESGFSMTQQFKTFQNMFLVVGGALCVIVGIIGILNFTNSELTGIIIRRREFAMLQSIGMTGNQLKKMLIYEGLFNTVISIITAFIFGSICGLLISGPVENILWFFTYKFTVVPVLIILPIFIFFGITIPVISYSMSVKQSIVERLREAE